MLADSYGWWDQGCAEITGLRPDLVDRNECFVGEMIVE